MPLQFTENTIANWAIACERLSCKTIIQPGEARFAAEDITGHIKYVCEACCAYYDQKEAQARHGNVAHTGIYLLLSFTTLINFFLGIRNTKMTSHSLTAPSPSVPQLDFQAMYQNVNESQRKGC